MSEAGIVIHNDNGDLLINSTYNNLYLMRKLKLTNLQYESLGRDTTFRFYADIQTNEIIAAIGRTNGNGLKAFCVRFGMRNTIPQWQIYVQSNGATISQLLTDLDNVYVYVFGINTSTQQTDTYGFQVFDEDGVCIYNSNDKPMRVLHYATNLGDISVYDTTLDGYIVPNNKVCAVANSVFYQISKGQFQARPIAFLYAYQSDSGEILQGDTQVGVAPVSIVQGDYLGYMVVDVTGY